MRQSSLTDEQLAVRLQYGDMQAVTVLYDRWKNGLFRFCLRMVRDDAAAEDIIHDAFVKLIGMNSSVNNPASLRSWMYTVVRNESLTFLDREKKLRPLNEQDEEIIEAGPETTLLESQEHTCRIAAMLDRLHPRYKEVLLLREYESMNYHEIAAVTGVTVGSVKSRLFKARRVLYKYLEPLRKEDEL
jgi:RNA polymerase sigma-70 factor (ECF subfamily)